MARTVSGPFTNLAAEVVMEESGSVLRVPVPLGPAFFRLSACRPTRVVGIAVRAGELVIRFE
jgi:hypothetical protein